MKRTGRTESRGASSGAFDGVRLVAALAVLYSHCYPLTGREGDEPLGRATGGAVGFGEIAVYAFFAISGYLVTQSWFRDPSSARFMARRALRILPGLAFVIVGSVVVIGPLTSALALQDYLAQPESWTYLAKMLVFPTQLGLPGTFTDNPFSGVVNGSLWTLRLEFALYLAVTVLGMLGLLRWRWVSAGLAAGCLGVNAALTGTSWLGGVPFAHQLAVLSANAVPFFIGVGLAQGDLAVVGGWIVAIALALSTMAALGTPAFTPLLLVTLPLAVILLARSGSCDLGRVGDLSYGTYLWAFPVQQTIVHFLPGMGPLPLFALAGTATILLAALSWHLIEKRALALKPRRPATSQDAAPLPGG